MRAARVRLSKLTLRNAQVRRISWVRGVRPAVVARVASPNRSPPATCSLLRPRKLKKGAFAGALISPARRGRVAFFPLPGGERVASPPQSVERRRTSRVGGVNRVDQSKRDAPPRPRPAPPP